MDNYVRNVAEAEFTGGECCEAWYEALCAAIRVSGNLDVLDVGTGPGVFACLYARMGHRCVGLDFSRRMLAEATKRAGQLKVACEFRLWRRRIVAVRRRKVQCGVKSALAVQSATAGHCFA